MVNIPKIHVPRSNTKATPIVKRKPTPDHHIVIGFEGFNIPIFQNAGDEIPLTTKDNRVVDIINKSTEGVPLASVSKIAYSTDFTEKARDKAELFVNDHLVIENGEQRGKVIIYGYSMGGDTAIELAEKLRGKCVVDLLITVDAATGGNIGVDRRIPSNVRMNINFWTKNPNTSLGQHGGPNHAEDPKVTKVYNYARHEEDHASISKATKEASIQYIKDELQNHGHAHVRQPVELMFDGTSVVVINPRNGKELARFAATSGLPAGAPHLKELIDKGRKDLDLNTDYRARKYERVADAGPIVESDYKLKLKPGMPYDKTSRNGVGWGLGGWKLETNFMQDLAIWLGGRGGFFLHHDGGSPGTSGCVGIINGADFKKLRQLLIDAQKGGQETAAVHVFYTRTKEESEMEMEQMIMPAL